MNRRADVEFLQRYGPWAVIAGASEGLGAEFAEQLARQGLNLVLVARRAGLLKELASLLTQKYRVEVFECVLDLATLQEAQELAESTRALDVGLLIYNAAFSAVGPFLQRPLEDHLKEIDTNIRTPLALLHSFGQRLAARGRGGVILMSSLSAFQGSAFITNYAATKAFNQLVGEGLWEEWRRQGVDVLSCAAGAIRTPNFMASQAKSTGGISDMTSEPGQVASEALSALGRQPFVIPGQGNRLASFLMRHLMPRRAAIQMMGKILEGKYSA